MSRNKSSFSNLNSYAQSTLITLVDGSKSIILGKGTVELNDSCTFTSNFFVPNFSMSLLFVSQVTKYLNYKVTFSLHIVSSSIW